jgi:hypothetical protein
MTGAHGSFECFNPASSSAGSCSTQPILFVSAHPTSSPGVKPPLTRDPHSRQLSDADPIPQRDFVEAEQITELGNREQAGPGAKFFDESFHYSRSIPDSM